ncbi:MAG: hypothetical protein ACYDIC_01880 [Desulfobaccales bacterium]
MNKRCSICNHPSRAEIDRGLLAGVPYRPLAAQHGLSPSSLSRHLRHLQQEITLEEHQAQQAQQQAVLEQLELLSIRLDRLFHNATDFHALHVALGCLRESIRLLSLQERFRHSLRSTP